jgi:hypothetical protein
VVQPFLSIEEEFTDNADQQKDNRRSEFRTSIAPGAAARIQRPLGTFALVYAPRYFFPDNRLQDGALDHNLTIREVWTPTPRIRLNVGDDFVDSTDFRDVEDPGTRRTGRARFLRNQATGEVAYTPPETEGQGALSYTHILVIDDRPQGEFSQTHIFRATGEYTSPLTQAKLGGSYALTRGELELEPSYWEHALQGRAIRPFTSSISGTLSGLATYHDAQDPGQDFTIGRFRLGGILYLGPNGSLEAEAGPEVFAPMEDEVKIRPGFGFTWIQRFTLFSLLARYEEGFRGTFAAVENLGVTRTRTASLLLTTTDLPLRDLLVTLEARWEENRFEQATVAGATAGTVDRTWDLEAGIRYYLARPLSLTLGYVFTIRTSTDRSAEFIENRVRVGLTYQYNVF